MADITYYYSPFPREKSNNEVLRKSYAKKISNNKTLISIPPSVTISYMKKNPFYFDLKSTKKKFFQQPKNNKINKNFTVYEKNKLEKILDGQKNFFVERPKLNEGCEKVKNLRIPITIPPQLTYKEILDIVNRIPEKLKLKDIKTPDYINEFRIREFIEREYERLVEEEKHYPKGTFKLWEGDKQIILDNLKKIKNDLLEQLKKFPVDYYLRSVGIRNKRAIIEKRLDEIDYAIKIFEMTEVLLKA